VSPVSGVELESVEQGRFFAGGTFAGEMFLSQAFGILFIKSEDTAPAVSSFDEENRRADFIGSAAN